MLIKSVNLGPGKRAETERKPSQMNLDDNEEGKLGRLSSLLPECKCLDLTLADGRRPRDHP